MSGKIKSDYNRIYIYPPNSEVSYMAELQQTDHIRVWVIMNGQRFPTEHIPFEVIPYLEVLMHRRRREMQHQFRELLGVYDYLSSLPEAETRVNAR